MSLAEQCETPVRRARNIPRATEILLAVRAGGCCEFRGCGAYLFEHSVTKDAGSFSQKAHIVAFSEQGPRSHDGARPEDIHSVENLMLLCAPCHKLIDDNPTRFGRAVLEADKKQHEQRIRRLTSLTPADDIVVCVVKCPVRGQHVDVPRDHILEAIAPFWPSNSEFVEIDLGSLDGALEGATFNDQACAKIDREIARMFAAGGPIEKTPRLAVFAIAPIPVLAFVGSKLDNKIPASLFQRHRDTEDWKWKSGGKQAAFQLSLRQTRPAGARVALVLSLSGTISLTDLPRDVQEGATIYEIALTSEKPSPTFLKQTADLSALRDVYYEFHAQLGAEHGYVDEIDVFPAVPAPVAILLGRERLMKRHPALRFYDYDRANGGFTFQMTVK